MKNLQLRTGSSMPIVGLGTYDLYGEECYSAVLSAIEVGYKNFDCASRYLNQADIGRAFEQAFNNGHKREELFITSKAWTSELRDVRKACLKTLEDLKIDYLDLYMIHWPFATVDKGDLATTEIELDYVPIHEVYRQFEQLYDEGLIKNIGISNFSPGMILDVLSYARVKPSVFQGEIHPYNSSTFLVNFCHKHDIHVVGYGSMGGLQWQGGCTYPVLTEHPLIQELANKYSKSTAQILLSWAISRNVIVIPKSRSRERQLDNLKSVEFEMEKEDVEAITRLNKNHRYYSKQWDKLGVRFFEDDDLFN
jgi:diketogulonate reductase-like aldo/keto reductase